MLKRVPWVWPVLLIVGGVALLLENFLLLEVNLAPYWPVLLLAAGAQLALRGDIGPGWQAHTFGITRGNVTSAALEVESGELDVQLHSLHKPGRLIAGQYTARSRPDLRVRHNHALLRMQRGQSWWLSLADWDVGLATDLPWSVLLSSYLGHLEADLHDLPIDRAYIASGFGNINVVCPREADDVVFARSAFGDVHLTIPKRSLALVRVQSGPLGRVRANRQCFRQLETGLYATAALAEAPEDTEPTLYVVAGTTFGTVYIACA